MLLHTLVSDLEAAKARLEEKVSGLETDARELLWVKQDQEREISRLKTEFSDLTRMLDTTEKHTVEENLKWRKAGTQLQHERNARKDVEARLESTAQAWKAAEAKLELERQARTAAEAALKMAES